MKPHKVVPDPCEFAERLYEHALLDELVTPGQHYFIPTQLLENEVGFDLAVGTTRRRLLRVLQRRGSIWSNVGLPEPPGAALTPALWNRRELRGRMPTGLFSLLLQVKRAERIHGHNGRMWHYWNEAYLRSDSTRQPQHRHLCTLERSLQRRAWVRYVSPGFLTLVEIDAYLRNRQILDHSVFVSPSWVGRHRRWTYIDTSGDVQVNPSDDELFDDRSGPRGHATSGRYFLTAPLPDELAPDDTFHDHLAVLGEVARGLLRDMGLEAPMWQAAESAHALLPNSWQLLEDHAAFSYATSLLGCVWLVGSVRS